MVDEAEDEVGIEGDEAVDASLCDKLSKSVLTSSSSTKFPLIIEATVLLVVPSFPCKYTITMVYHIFYLH